MRGNNREKTGNKRFLVDGEQVFCKYATGRKWQAATATKKKKKENKKRGKKKNNGRPTSFGRDPSAD